MSSNAPNRDLADEARERELFRILKHVFLRTQGDVSLNVLSARVADDLGLQRLDASALIDELVRAGFFVDGAAGPSVRLSETGRRYLLQLAGRRRSVRRADPPAAQGRFVPAFLGRLVRSG
jgi:uncharacterized protein YjiS (DUF1127 family)